MLSSGIARLLTVFLFKGSTESLLPAFDLLASLLLESGSEAREAPAVKAHAEIREQLRSSANDPAAVTRQLVRALRLMAAQLRLLQIDMSNSTLRMLAVTLGGQEGLRSVLHLPAQIPVSPYMCLCNAW